MEYSYSLTGSVHNMEDTNASNGATYVTSPQDHRDRTNNGGDQVFHSSQPENNKDSFPSGPPDYQRQNSHGANRKTSSGSSNSCHRMSSSDDDDFCDCDACLLGFDDTRPGEVIDAPRKKKATPVKMTIPIILLILFLFVLIQTQTSKALIL